MWKEKEYIELLESNGIDTVCFMGSGWKIEDVKVGSEFYLTYAFFGRSAKQDVLDILDDCLLFYDKFNVLDKYKLISKSKYFINRLNPKIKNRREWVVIKNLRTKEKIVLKDSWGYTGGYGNDSILIDHFYYFLFDTID